MQNTSILQKKHYHINSIDGTDYSQLVWKRKEKLDKLALLMSEGCAQEIALEAIGIKRSSYYRWKKNYEFFGLEGLENASRRPDRVRTKTWTLEVEMRIYHLRKKYPLWGKQKLAVMYRRHFGNALSESTIGRIITKLIRQGKVMPVLFMFGKKAVKNRKFNGHAQRWKYGMKAKQAGELVQLDHMTVSVPGIGQIKNFNAVCPVTKYAVHQVYKTATSKNAADFLKLIQEKLPFSLISLQVDGGSEFMADFEKACFEAKIPLFVLPPRRPEFNGNVERGNGTVKYEFYAQYDAQPSFHILQKKLHKFTHFYNFVRPHQGIGLLTPNQFYEEIANKRLQSHMY